LIGSLEGAPPLRQWSVTRSSESTRPLVVRRGITPLVLPREASDPSRGIGPAQATGTVLRAVREWPPYARKARGVEQGNDAAADDRAMRDGLHGSTTSRVSSLSSPFFPVRAQAIAERVVGHRDMGAPIRGTDHVPPAVPSAMPPDTSSGDAVGMVRRRSPHAFLVQLRSAFPSGGIALGIVSRAA
jgi:hypothetical protein